MTHGPGSSGSFRSCSWRTSLRTGLLGSTDRSGIRPASWRPSGSCFAGAATTLAVGALLVLERELPLSVAVTGGVIATGLMGVLQVPVSAVRLPPTPSQRCVRVLIVGAGESAGAILRELARQPASLIKAVGLLDDDPRKLGRWLGGVPIVGRIDDLVEAGQRLEAEQVLLAIPSADSALVRQVADGTAKLGLPLKVLPSVSELMNGQPRLRDVRDLSIADLLGRQQISTDLASVQALIRSRRVLVTGGGGSIGSEIVRQVAAYEPSRLVVLDRDETHLFDALAAVGGNAVPVLLDVRDRERLATALARGASRHHLPRRREQARPSARVASGRSGRDERVRDPQSRRGRARGRGGTGGVHLNGQGRQSHRA
jgi:FlaA1/EpsC-like NDP-sugar epimerase